MNTYLEEDLFADVATSKDRGTQGEAASPSPPSPAEPKAPPAGEPAPSRRATCPSSVMTLFVIVNVRFEMGQT